MKYYVAIALFFLMFFGSQVQAKVDNPVEHCTEYSDAAKYIMDIRQQGYSLPDVMRYFQEKGLIESTPIVSQFIERAYSKPHFNTEEYKNKAITAFENDVFMECLKEVRRNNAA